MEIIPRHPKSVPEGGPSEIHILRSTHPHPELRAMPDKVMLGRNQDGTIAIGVWDMSENQSAMVWISAQDARDLAATLTSLAGEA